MKIKKLISVVFSVLFSIASLSATELEEALLKTAKQFSSSIKSGTTIAIVGLSSPTKELSDFMLDEITIGFVRERKLTVANRANLEAIKTEMNFQLSGEVSDASIQKIGAMVGANVVIHGNLVPLGKKYNLTIQALDVTSATVLDMNRVFIEPNDTINSLLDGTPTQNKKNRKQTPVPNPQISSKSNAKQNFGQPSKSQSNFTESQSKINIPKGSNDYHIVDISNIPAGDIEDRFIVYNRTEIPIQVAVYYVGANNEWVYTGGQMIKRRSSDSITELNNKKTRPPFYGIRVADATGGQMKFLVSWDIGSDDLHIYIEPSFF